MADLTDAIKHGIISQPREWGHLPRSLQIVGFQFYLIYPIETRTTSRINVILRGDVTLRTWRIRNTY